MPAVALFPARDRRCNDETIKTIWGMLETNRLGGDPTAKNISLPRKRSCAETREAKYRDLSAIATYGIGVMRRLMVQPSLEQTKRLALSVCKEAQTFALLNGLGEILNSEIKHLYVNTQGFEGGALLEYFSPSSDANLTIFETAYREAVRRVGSGWKQAHLKDYPHILNLQSEEEYVLFIKKTPNFVGLEQVFLRNVLDGLEILKWASCSDRWKNGSPYGVVKPIYLWIRKDRQEEVRRKLNLSLIV